MKLKLNKFLIEEALKIKIKKENRGKFTSWCKEQGFPGVTCECINKGLAAGGSLAKEANFARNFGHPECKGKK